MDNENASSRPALRPYQADGLAFLRRNPRAFLADEPGLGKTRQLIEAAEGRTLVVAPAMVLDGGTWADELARWAGDRAGSFTLGAYTSLNARDGRKILPTVRPEYRGPWDTVILDEAHYIKNRDTNWTKLVQKLCRDADRVMLATGTPIVNWAPELFVPLQILKPHQAKAGGELGSYWRWAGTWFDTTPQQIRRFDPATKTVIAKEVQHVGDMLGCGSSCEERPPTDPCEHYRRFYTANLGGLFLQRLRDDVLTDLPPLTVQQVLTPMVPAQAKAYRTMKKEWLAELPSGELQVAWSASARHVMLDKLATGVEILSADLGPASGKLNQLREDLASRTRPTLVVAHYRPTVEACARVAEQLGRRVGWIHGGTTRPERQRVVAEFKAGRIDVLVGSLSTIAEGLTLTQADMVIFVEHCYKPSTNTQAVRRIHRLGQERPCTMLDYVTPGSIDEGKRELLASKTDHQIRTLSAAQFAGIA